MKYLIAVLLFLGTFSAHAFPDGDRIPVMQSPTAWGFMVDNQPDIWVCGRLVGDLTKVKCVSDDVEYKCTYYDPPKYFDDCIKEND